MEDDPQTQAVDPTQVLAPFYTAELNHRERIQALTRNLTDEELDQVAALFARDNHANVPFAFWMLASRVRAHIRVEKKRRQQKENT